jgi:hypothetical protein
VSVSIPNFNGRPAPALILECFQEFAGSLDRPRRDADGQVEQRLSSACFAKLASAAIFVRPVFVYDE